MKQKVSFSKQIKDELSQVPCCNSCCRQVELATIYLVSGKYNEHEVVLSTGHQGFAERVAALMEMSHGIRPDVCQGQSYFNIRLDLSAYDQTIRKDIETVFDNPDRHNRSAWPFCCCRAFLRSLYLACGSVSEPRQNYHLEISVRRDRKAVELMSHLLDQMDFHNTLISRAHYDVILLHEGQQLADYLQIAGAQQSLLEFESLRVEKEMRSSVNRVVNCDNANLQRMVEAAARQSALLTELQGKKLDRRLPEDLKKAAELRQKNPELSLKELGVLMEPPLGKSGMNHRLRKFESMAAQLLSDSEGALDVDDRSCSG